MVLPVVLASPVRNVIFLGILKRGITLDIVMNGLVLVFVVNELRVKLGYFKVFRLQEDRVLEERPDIHRSLVSRRILSGLLSVFRLQEDGVLEERPDIHGSLVGSRLFSGLLGLMVLFTLLSMMFSLRRLGLLLSMLCFMFLFLLGMMLSLCRFSSFRLLFLVVRFLRALFMLIKFNQWLESHVRYHNFLFKVRFGLLVVPAVSNSVIHIV